MNLLNNVAIQWLIRRVPDWGGWIGTIASTLFGIYSLMTPAQREVVQMALSGNWQQITLGTLVPLLVLIYSQVVSFRATVKPQIVDRVAGTTVSKPLDEVPASTKERIATAAAPRKTLWDILTGK